MPYSPLIVNPMRQELAAIGFEDLMTLLNAWGECAACPADINGTGDGWVGYDDLAMLLGAWGPC